MSDPFTGYRVNVFNPIVSRDEYAELQQRNAALALAVQDANDRTQKVRERHAALVRALEALRERMRAGSGRVHGWYWAKELDQVLAAHQEPR